MGLRSVEKLVLDLQQDLVLVLYYLEVSLDTEFSLISLFCLSLSLKILNNYHENNFYNKLII